MVGSGQSQSTVLQALVARATLAPSPRNLQPWRWTVHSEWVDLELAPEGVPATDARVPGTRELVMACGAGLFGLRVAAARMLFNTRVTVQPDPLRPELLARVELAGGAVDAAFSALDIAVPRRHTVREELLARPVPAPLVHQLQAEAAAEGATLRSITAEDLEPLLWLAMRRLERGRRAADAAADRIERAPLVLVLGTLEDQPRDWLAAGQALQRVLLCAASQSVLAGFANEVCQVPTVRARLADLLPDPAWPQAVLRMGYPARVPEPTTRRPVTEVVRDVSGAEPTAADQELTYSSPLAENDVVSDTF